MVWGLVGLGELGDTFPTDEYNSAEFRVAKSTFDCIDFGENLKLSASLGGESTSRRSRRN